jgi:hypothetical protein
VRQSGQPRIQLLYRTLVYFPHKKNSWFVAVLVEFFLFDLVRSSALSRWLTSGRQRRKNKMRTLGPVWIKELIDIY